MKTHVICSSSVFVDGSLTNGVDPQRQDWWSTYIHVALPRAGAQLEATISAKHISVIALSVAPSLTLKWQN